MKILDKYIFKQVFLAALLAVLIVLIVWVSPEILFKIIKKTVNGEISTLIAFKIFFAELPEILGKAVPIGLMLSALFVFDRLSRDSELIVIKGIGVSFIRILYPLIFIGLIGTGICFYNNEVLVPSSTKTLDLLKNNKDSDYFVYVDKNTSGRPDMITIVGNYDGKNIDDIKFLMFSSTSESGIPEINKIITGDKALWTGNSWKVLSGTVYDINSDGVYKNISPFKSMQVKPVNSSSKVYTLLVNSIKKAKSLSISELNKYVYLLKTADMPEEFRYMLTKCHQRYAHSFACFFLIICGAVLGFSKPRDRRFLGFTAGVALIFVYYMILPFLDMLAQMGILLPVVSAWTPNVIILIATICFARFKQI